MKFTPNIKESKPLRHTMVRLTDDNHSRLKETAARLSVSMTMLVNQMVEHCLNEVEVDDHAE